MSSTTPNPQKPRILLLDASSSDRLLIINALFQNYAFLEAPAELIDLVLIDRVDPILKEQTTAPIILLSASLDLNLVKAALQAGYTDFLRKPLDLEELQIRLQLNLKAKAERDLLETQVDDLKEQSSRDPLTYLYNRRFFKEHATRELAKAKRNQHPASLLMIDIDHFKNINDTYGHSFGDEILVQIAKLLHKQLRSSDLICRQGGDEFVVLLPSTTEQQAELVGNKLLKAILQHHF